MEDTVNPSLREPVLAALAEGPRSRGELHAALPDVENAKQLANCLYNLRQAGLIRREADGRYRLAGRGGKKAMPEIPMPSPARTDKPPRRERVRVDDPAIDRGIGARKVQSIDAGVLAMQVARGGIVGINAATRRALEKVATDAQAALDDYLAAIGDPRIIEPLRAVRDNARAALEAEEGK